MLTFYGVHKNRGKTALDEFNILPEFIGRLIHDFWKPYFSFDCLHGLCNPFTNNLGEQDIRMIKVRLKVSGYFRTLNGARKFARIRGYLSTSRKNNHNLLDAIAKACQGDPIFPQHNRWVQGY